VIFRKMKATLILIFAASFIGCSSFGKTPDNKTANNRTANSQTPNAQTANETLPSNQPAGDRTTNLGEKFVLKKNEAAKIKNTNLRLKMLSAGQAQVEEGGDIPFCKFEVEFKNKTEQMNLSVGKSATFGNLSVKLQSVNTTANPKAKDPWSDTSCGFVVTKNTK